MITQGMPKSRFNLAILGLDVGTVLGNNSILNSMVYSSDIGI